MTPTSRDRGRTTSLRGMISAAVGRAAAAALLVFRCRREAKTPGDARRRHARQVERDAGDVTDPRRSRDVRSPVDPPPDDVGAPSLFFERARRFGDEEPLDAQAGISKSEESLLRLQNLRRGSENLDTHTPKQLNRTSLGVIHQQSALADGLALPPLIDEAWEEAPSGATDLESRPRPLTKGEENHASYGVELLQPSAAEYHDVVACTKSYAKQLDRERESCESIDFAKHNEGEDSVNFAEQDDLLSVAGKSDDQSVMSLSQWLGDDYIDEEGDIESIGREPPHSTSVPIEPSDGDVLYGRGGNANSHPGNIRFREKARELLPRYLLCSKEDKTLVSVELMESVTRKGHRFIKRRSDGIWDEVDRDSARKKASQCFRDLNDEVKCTASQNAPTEENASRALLEERASSSPSSAAMGGQDIDPISIGSNEWKKGNPDNRLTTEFFEETTFDDEPPSYQPSPINPSRLIDPSCPIEYTEHDVLYGRGGNANTHPGNIRFREKARGLLPRYLLCSKEGKKPVSVELMESVTREGHRFLEKSSDGKWYKVVNPRIKASQAFRDALRVLLKDVASMSIEWGQNVENVVGDLDPTNDEWEFDPDSLDKEELYNLISQSLSCEIPALHA